MTKNELIEELSKIEGNPDVYMDLGESGIIIVNHAYLDSKGDIMIEF